MIDSRGKKVEVSCQNKICRAKFWARAADIKRGWGKFCSKSCKALVQEKKTGKSKEHYQRQTARDFDDCGEPLISGHNFSNEGHGLHNKDRD